MSALLCWAYPGCINTKKQMRDGTTSHIKNVPIGTCGLIVPWNFPVLLGMWKTAPALAAGNTVIFKPSEWTPLTFIRFADLLKEAGLPDGVFNLVLGDGKVGKEIVEHETIKKISFTGSIPTGKSIYSACAASLKRISLELGGKSPFIICENIDEDQAADWAVFASLFNQGEVCVAAPRLLIHHSIYESVKQKLLEKIDQLNIGDPLSSSVDLGPLISRSHTQQVEDYIIAGKKEGASLLTGGKRIKTTGNFLSPAVFENVTQEMSIVQEEIFGPVITLQSFMTDEEAVELANGTDYGLAAGILTENSKQASYFTDRLDCGIVWVNSYHTPYIEAPWGGIKASGIGRELGVQGFIISQSTSM
ncbi:aldehyde dehydrogenase [Alteribacillus sp. JSM 102045]|uniref:aldehyde dehydrogenase family protein n=1 Tax=Alteribacillus sp. JSM 102045 TaxID=1562101 RepID=UPI0035C235A9